MKDFQVYQKKFNAVKQVYFIYYSRSACFGEGLPVKNKWACYPSKTTRSTSFKTVFKIVPEIVNNTMPPLNSGQK